jgi:predicted transcriptional regulator
MSEVTILRKQVKKFIDNASEKELEIVYHIFEATNQTDWWDEISNPQKKAINKGLDQLDKGKGIPHKEVMKKYNKWLTK